jgi:hypothetical protein
MQANLLAGAASISFENRIAVPSSASSLPKAISNTRNSASSSTPLKVHSLARFG